MMMMMTTTGQKLNPAKQGTVASPVRMHQMVQGWLSRLHTNSVTVPRNDITCGAAYSCSCRIQSVASTRRLNRYAIVPTNRIVTPIQWLITVIILPPGPMLSNEVIERGNIRRVKWRRDNQSAGRATFIQAIMSHANFTLTDRNMCIVQHNLHCVSKKGSTTSVAITLSNLNRFSKFLHR